MNDSAYLAADLIVAIATPQGCGGIGILRLSGAGAVHVAQTLIDPATPTLVPRLATFTRLLDPEGSVLDEAVVTFFAAPHSYTSEDVVEIAAHGSPVLLDSLLRRLIGLGARLAEPGEFTRRAFLSGRLDLTQAEAVQDLISSQTFAQAQLAARQLGGALAHAVAPVKHSLLNLIAALEAGMDFAAEDNPDDIDRLPPSQIAAKLLQIAEPLATLERTYRYASVLREGFTIALAGRPNAGKSSLFNALIERSRAIVTAEAGTTRDPIHETITLSGIPIRLIDTAGLRTIEAAPIHPAGEAEQLGIAKSHEAIADADLILHVVDATCIDFTYAAAEFTRDRTLLSVLAARPHLTVLNKMDLLPAPPAPPGIASGSTTPIRLLKTSATTGEGLPELRAAILAAIQAQPPESSQPMVTNLRQHTSIASALSSIEAATQATAQHLPHELLLVDLHTALHHLDDLTGTTTSDDILTLIFSTFCIGK